MKDDEVWLGDNDYFFQEVFIPLTSIMGRRFVILNLKEN